MYTTKMNNTKCLFSISSPVQQETKMSLHLKLTLHTKHHYSLSIKCLHNVQTMHFNEHIRLKMSKLNSNGTELTGSFLQPACFHEIKLLWHLKLLAKSESETEDSKQAHRQRERHAETYACKQYMHQDAKRGDQANTGNWPVNALKQ